MKLHYFTAFAKLNPAGSGGEPLLYTRVVAPAVKGNPYFTLRSCCSTVPRRKPLRLSGGQARHRPGAVRVAGWVGKTRAGPYKNKGGALVAICISRRRPGDPLYRDLYVPTLRGVVNMSWRVLVRCCAQRPRHVMSRTTSRCRVGTATACPTNTARPRPPPAW